MLVDHPHHTTFTRLIIQWQNTAILKGWLISTPAMVKGLNSTASYPRQPSSTLRAKLGKVLPKRKGRSMITLLY